MRRFWFSSLSTVTRTAAAAALGLMLTTATTSAADRDDSDNSDSSKASSDSDVSNSRDNDQSSSSDSNDRSDQNDRGARNSQQQQQQSSQATRSGQQAGRQTGHATLGVTFYSDQSAPLEVRRVTPGSPAEHAGLERGDEILSVDGRRVSSVQQLRQQIDRAGPNEDVEFGVLRDGRRTSVTAKLTASQQAAGSQSGSSQQGQQQQGRNRQPWSEQQYGGNQGQNPRGSEYEQGYWAGYERAQQELGQRANQGYNENYSQANRGQGFANRDRGYASQGYGNQGYGSYARGSRGVDNSQDERNSRTAQQAFLGVTLDENNRNVARVSNIYPNSPAEEAGLRPGDEIVSIDDENVKSSRDVRRVLGQKDAADDVAIEVRRGGRQRTLHATLVSQQEFQSSHDEGSHRTGLRTSYDEQGNSGESRSRRQQNQRTNEDQENDNY